MSACIEARTNPQTQFTQVLGARIRTRTVASCSGVGREADVQGPRQARPSSAGPSRRLEFRWKSRPNPSVVPPTFERVSEWPPMGVSVGGRPVESSLPLPNVRMLGWRTIRRIHHEPLHLNIGGAGVQATLSAKCGARAPAPDVRRRASAALSTPRTPSRPPRATMAASSARGPPPERSSWPSWRRRRRRNGNNLRRARDTREPTFLPCAIAAGRRKRGVSALLRRLRNARAFSHRGVSPPLPGRALVRPPKVGADPPRRRHPRTRHPRTHTTLCARRMRGNQCEPERRRTCRSMSCIADHAVRSRWAASAPRGHRRSQESSAPASQRTTPTTNTDICRCHRSGQLITPRRMGTGAAHGGASQLEVKVASELRRTHTRRPTRQESTPQTQTPLPTFAHNTKSEGARATDTAVGVAPLPLALLVWGSLHPHAKRQVRRKTCESPGAQKLLDRLAFESQC